jgi:hypothetical protein
MIIRLPTYSGIIEDYKLSGSRLSPKPPKKPFNRIAFAAAHVVTDPLKDNDPWQGRPAIDWDNTLKIRHYLWDQGLHLAEVMDTAQRGMGLDWETAKELIFRTIKDAKLHPLKPHVVCGAGTDHYDIQELNSYDKIITAYSEQMEHIEAIGGQIVIMASRAMTLYKRGPAYYARVYKKLIEQAKEPVILHWLGEMFDPSLRGYWGSTDFEKAADSVLTIINSYSNKIDGIKISILDQEREEKFRARLPNGVKLYTGDDFNFPALIEGDGKHFSHALLGIFTAIAPAASQALEALAMDDGKMFNKILMPTVPLSREIFKSPTQYYKAGISFLAWLNGIQSHFIMPRGFQSSRQISHYAEVFRLADKARLLIDTDLALYRMKILLGLHGIV